MTTVEVELTEAVTGEAGDDDGPVDKGTVPLEPLKNALLVRFKAGKV